MKLFDSSKVYEIRKNPHKFVGVCTIVNLAYYLADKHGERGNPNGPNTIAKLKQMQLKGHTVFNGSHYIVEKTIPIELRNDLRSGTIDVRDVIEKLEL